MKYRLQNKKAGTKLTKTVSLIVNRHFNKNVLSVIKLRDDKEIYKVLLENDEYLRLDVFTNPTTTFSLHLLAVENDLPVPKIILTIVFNGLLFKFCEWIKGEMLMKVWNKKETFLELGSILARINSITLSKKGKKLFLCHNGLSAPNCIIDETGKIYIVDVGGFKARVETDSSMVKYLLKYIVNKQKIEWVLQEYSKYKDTTKIKERIEKANWKWPKTKKKVKPKLYEVEIEELNLTKK